jgi:hypothetical protein
MEYLLSTRQTPKSAAQTETSKIAKEANLMAG